MSRSLPEWIGKTPDTPVPDRVRVRVYTRDDGRCQCGCGHRIFVGDRWQTDHIIALINGGENRESNLRTLLSGHHADKTAEDVAIKAKTYARKAKDIGVKKSRTPIRGWRRFDGSPVRNPKLGNEQVER